MLCSYLTPIPYTLYPMDYYQTLGVDKGASKDDIKKAFRKLAHQYHPDKQGGDEARFKEINEAYTVLSDEKKRAEYDAYGRTFSGAGGGGGPAGGFGGFDFSGFAGQGFGQGAGGVEFDLGDMFGDLFGGGRSRTRRGRDISVDIELSFKESVFGVERVLLLNKVAACTECDGTGAKDPSDVVTCGTCNGAGKIHDTKQTVFGTFATTRVCSTCHGRGTMPREKCTTCHGEGVLRREQEHKIAVPAGVEDGEMIRMTGGGEAVQGGAPGDLYVKLHVKKDPGMRKEGPNIVMQLPVKLSDALLGAKYHVETLEGELAVKIPAGVNSGERLRVKGKGVPLGRGSRGDLFLLVDIKLPTKLSKAAQKAVETLREEGV